MAPARPVARTLAGAAIAIIAVALAITAPPAAAQTPRGAPAHAEPDPAPGHFLVASESIRDPRFRRTVILLINHDDGGSLGVILNRPGEMPLSDVFPRGAEDEAAGHDTAHGADHDTGTDPAPGVLHFGGPVQPRVFSMLFRSDAVPGSPGDGHGQRGGDTDGAGDHADGSDHHEDGDGGDEDSLDIVRVLGDVDFVLGYGAVARVHARLDRDDPRRVFAGYAGWSAGQLQGEIARGGWHLIAASPDLIFSDSDAVWDVLMRKLRGRWI